MLSEHVIKELLRLEEALHLSLSALGGVGGVADIEHAVGAEITADGTLISLHGVGGPKDGAHTSNNAGAGKYQSHNRAGLHECGELREQGLTVNHEVDNVAVMLTQNGIVQLHHLHAAQVETLCQQTLQNNTGQVLAHTIRLKKNQCFFVVHKKLYQFCVSLTYLLARPLSRGNHILPAL